LKILLAGCGDIGQRVVTKLAPSYQCFGLRRSAFVFSDQITSIVGDLTDQNRMRVVFEEKFDIVVATLTPSSRSEDAYKKAYVETSEALTAVINQATYQPKLVIWISSTSVFGESASGWMDESSPARPTSFSGQALLNAEHNIGELRCKHIVLRFSGIYGPGRRRLISEVERGIGRPAKPEYWTNRIHSEDCAGIIAYLVDACLADSPLESLYIATDCQPVTQHNLRKWLATKIDVRLTEQPAKRGLTRCLSNKRLIQTGYQFLFPTYQEGYQSLLKDVNG
jgi:dTDP-4-dehydrorhamnose reductase